MLSTKNRTTLTGLIAALLFSWGLSLSLIRTYQLDFPLLHSLLAILLPLLLLSLVLLNRATRIISLILFLSSALIAYYFFFDLLLPIFSDFFINTYNFMRGTEQLNPSYQSLFPSLLCLLITIISFPLAARLRGSIFLLISAAAIFFIQWDLGYRDIFVEMSAVITAIFVVAIAEYANKEAQKNTDMSTSHPRPAVLALSFLPLSLLITAVCAAVLPEDAQNYRSIVVETAIDDIVDIFGADIGFSRTRSPFTLSGFGYNSELGGPVKLSDEVFMTVKTTGPTLLRASVKDFYSGHSWEDSIPAAQYRFDAPMWNELRVQAFNSELPLYMDTASLKNFARPSSLEIVNLNQYYPNVLFSSGRPLSVTPLDNALIIPYFSTTGEFFSKRSLNFGNSYIVNESQLPFTSTGFTQAVINYESQLADMKASGLVVDEDYVEIKENYSQLPGVLPSFLPELAAQLTGNSKSEYSKVLVLRQFIASHFTYTLSPQPVPSDREFIGWFFETREGYCTYYATTLTIMARCIGIPSRYVEGFSLLDPDNTAPTVYEVTGEQAHAWCEVYIEGLGWIPVDPTISYSSTTIPEPDISPDTGTIQPSETFTPLIEVTPVPESFAPLTSAVTPPSDTTPTDTHFSLPFPLLCIGIILLSLLAIPVFIFTLIRFLRTPFSLNHLQKRRTPSAIVLIYWRDIVDMLARMQLVREPGETASHFCSRIGNRVYVDICGFDVISGLMEDCIYGNTIPSQGDLELLRQFHRELDRMLMRALLPLKYLAYRISALPNKRDMPLITTPDLLYEDCNKASG